MGKKLKATLVALAGLTSDVQFNKKRGEALFQSLNKTLATLFRLLGFDVRKRRDGRIFFQLRDRKQERKIEKKIRKILAQ